MKHHQSKHRDTKNGVAKSGVLAILGWYRQYRGLRPDACRFDPTCSAFALEAVEVHGPLKGLYFATRRILRCHPLGGRGYDPVPERSLVHTDAQPTLKRHQNA